MTLSPQKTHLSERMLKDIISEKRTLIAPGTSSYAALYCPIIKEERRDGYLFIYPTSHQVRFEGDKEGISSYLGAIYLGMCFNLNSSRDSTAVSSEMKALRARKLLVAGSIFKGKSNKRKDGLDFGFKGTNPHIV